MLNILGTLVYDHSLKKVRDDCCPFATILYKLNFIEPWPCVHTYAEELRASLCPMNKLYFED